MKKTWFLIFVGVFIGLLPLFILVNKAESLPQSKESENKVAYRNAIDVTSSLNFKVDPKIISHITISRDNDLIPDMPLVKIIKVNAIGEKDLKTFEDATLLDKFSFGLITIHLGILDDGKIVLSAPDEVKNKYTQDEIIKGINDLNLSQFLSKPFPLRLEDESVKKNRATWK